MQFRDCDAEWNQLRWSNRWRIVVIKRTVFFSYAKFWTDSDSNALIFEEATCKKLAINASGGDKALGSNLKCNDLIRLKGQKVSGKGKISNEWELGIKELKQRMNSRLYPWSREVP